jgi:uncharacterized ion transporter superfamily protein YfcC
MKKRIILLIVLFIMSVTFVLLFKNYINIEPSNSTENKQLAANRQTIEPSLTKKELSRIKF